MPREGSAYDDAVRWLYGLSSRGIELGLARMQAALARWGDPHRQLRFVHVGGTNGKGSTCAVVERALREAGHRTGLYTSPHLHRFSERIRVDGRPIPDAALARLVGRLRDDPAMPPLTFFEAATLIALERFREVACEVVVLEVGLGGRLDSTNVVDAELAVLTNVGLDHVAWLGDTYAPIAAEKVAIAKPGRTLLHGVDVPEARAVVERYAAEHGVRLVSLADDVEVRAGAVSIDVRLAGDAITSVPRRLAGAHQVENLALAVSALLLLRARGMGVDDDAIRRGAAKVRWPGRLELLPGAPALLLDGAHNAEGCAALAAHLRALPRRGPVVLVFGGMADKDLVAMLGAFDGLVDDRVYVAPALGRAATPSTFASIRPGHEAGSVEVGVALAGSLAGETGLVVVAGSLFVVAAARAARLGLRVDPPIAM